MVCTIDFGKVISTCGFKMSRTQCFQLLPLFFYLGLLINTSLGLKILKTRGTRIRCDWLTPHVYEVSAATSPEIMAKCTWSFVRYKVSFSFQFNTCYHRMRPLMATNFTPGCAHWVVVVDYHMLFCGAYMYMIYWNDGRCHGGIKL